MKKIKFEAKNFFSAIAVLISVLTIVIAAIFSWAFLAVILLYYPLRAVLSGHNIVNSDILIWLVAVGLAISVTYSLESLSRYMFENFTIASKEPQNKLKNNPMKIP